MDSKFSRFRQSMVFLSFIVRSVYRQSKKNSKTVDYFLYMKRRFSKEEDDVDDFTYNRRAQMAEDQSAEIPTKASNYFVKCRKEEGRTQGGVQMRQPHMQQVLPFVHCILQPL